MKIGFRKLPFFLCLIWSQTLFPQTKIQVISPPQQISPDSVRLIQPVYSPDGRWIAAAGEQYRGIALLDSSGRFVRWLTRLEGAGFRFQWSKDAQKLLCRVFKTENRRRKSSIAIISFDMSSIKLLTDWDKNLGLPGWINRGKSVYFLHHNELQILEVEKTVFNEEEEWLRYLLPGNFSPDELLVYVSNDQMILSDYRKTYHLNIIYADQHLINPTLSPDSDWVIFEVLGLGLKIAHRSGKPIINLGNYHSPSWSPSGKWLVCYKSQDDGLRTTTSELYAIFSDGKQIIPLTKTQKIQEQLPNWSPDGNFIICSDNLTQHIFRMELKMN